MAAVGLDDLIDRFRSAATPSDLWERAVAVLHGEGVDRICYYHFPPPTPGADPFFATDGWPKGWTSRYLGARIWRIDPAAQALRERSGPVLWSEISAMTDMTAEQARYVRDVEDSGLIEGVVFRVFGPFLRNGVVGLGCVGGAACLAPAGIARFQVIGQAAHLRYCELTHDRDPTPAGLSPREREIVDRMAFGDTNKAIAHRLRLSPHTVDTMVRRLFDKLGVTDRTSAAILALGSGMILPEMVRGAELGDPAGGGA